MKKIEAEVFKANCLAIVNQIQAKRETVVIMKSGKAVAKLVPVSTDAHEIYGFLAGRGSIAGDIVSPAISANVWSAPN
jgi:antitoxin (DNA-binding transcriptional repressor) of toxin-antitoxin stability system